MEIGNATDTKLGAFHSNPRPSNSNAEAEIYLFMNLCSMIFEGAALSKDVNLFQTVWNEVVTFTIHMAYLLAQVYIFLEGLCSV